MMFPKKLFRDKDDLLLLYFLIVLLAFNAYVGLWDQDEGAYAVMAKNMLDTNHWLIPGCQWCFIHRKPPFHIWTIALSYLIFGFNTFAVRFFSALAVWLSLRLMMNRLKNLVNDTVARLSVIVLGTNLLVVFIGKVAFTDAWMLLFYTWGGLSLWQYLYTGQKKRLAEFYTAMALALLVKGPPFLIFAGILWILLLIFWPDKKRILATKPWIWGVLAMVPFAFWLYGTYIEDPAFTHWWLDWYVFRRVKQPVLNQTGPPGTYFLLFGLTFLVFMPFVYYSIIDIFRKKTYHRSVLMFPSLWLLSGWLVYEFLQSKLPAYVLAAYPPFAILIAKSLYDFGRGRNGLKMKWLWYVQWVLYALFSLGGMILFYMGIIRFHWKIFENRTLAVAILAILFFVLLCFSVKSYHLAANLNFMRSLRLLIYQAFFMIAGLFLAVYPLSDSFKNATRKVTGTLVSKNYKSFDKIIITNDFGKPPSLIFYLRKNFPDKKIVIYDQPDKDQYVLKNFGSPDTVWIISPLQAEKLRKKYSGLEDKFKILRVESLNTGRVGKNDYIIILAK